METWHNVAMFGAPVAPEARVVRPGAYALIVDGEGRLAVVHTAQGTYLPGGGIDSGESPERTITREAFEECGLRIRPGAWHVRAVQFVYSEAEKTHFEKRSTFLEADVDGPTYTGLETDHKLAWLKPELAIEKLSHESQRWAVECWMSRK